MCRRNPRILVLLSLSLLVGCGGDGGPSGPGGGGGGDDGPFTATIDGVAWTADEATISVTGAGSPTREGQLIISGFEADSGRGLSLVLGFFIGPAAQPLGVNPGTTPGGTATIFAAGDSWLTPFSGAAGFITLTARTSTRIAGTFNFTAAALASATPATRVVTGGEFDITVPAGLPPLPTGVGSTAIATIGGAPWYAATIVGLASGGTFSVAADNAAYSISLVPKQPVAAGNTYGIPSQMGITVLRTGTIDSWWGGLGPDIGTMTISAFGPDRLVASFSANLAPLNAAAPLNLQNGAINTYLSALR